MVVIYFSGTGNSRFAANYFAKSMECDCYSIEQELDFDAIMASNHTLAFFILYTVQVIYARHLNMPNNICNLSFLPVKNHPDIDKQIEK